jgi:hypothetical protein
VDTDSGELEEKRLGHREEAEAFYRALAGHKVRVGMEASGHARWFERLVAELQFELWIGDAAEIRTKRVRKQKTDRQDAQLILRLLLEDRFPQIWGAELGESGSAVAPATMHQCCLPGPYYPPERIGTPCGHGRASRGGLNRLSRIIQKFLCSPSTITLSFFWAPG